MTLARSTRQGRMRIVAALEAYAAHLTKTGDKAGARTVRRKAQYAKRLRPNLKPTPKARELPRLERVR